MTPQEIRDAVTRYQKLFQNDDIGKKRCAPVEQRSLYDLATHLHWMLDGILDHLEQGRKKDALQELHLVQEGLTKLHYTNADIFGDEPVRADVS